MILVIDAGNSRLKWGIAPAGADVTRGAWHRVGSLDNSRLDALGDQWASLPAPRRVLCANVAGESSADAISKALAAWRAQAIWLRAQPRAAGVRNLYEIPGQLGPDRWAAGVAAWHRKAAACIVINAGTATTIDFISDAAEFLGGMILPGIMLMKQALQRGTAELPLQQGTVRIPSRNTADAIETGCMIAQLGAVERARREFTAGASLLLSGGWSGLLAPALAPPCEELPHLVLEGLYVLACAAEQPA